MKKGVRINVIGFLILAWSRPQSLRHLPQFEANPRETASWADLSWVDAPAGSDRKISVKKYHPITFLCTKYPYQVSMMSSTRKHKSSVTRKRSTRKAAYVVMMKLPPGVNVQNYRTMTSAKKDAAVNGSKKHQLEWMRKEIEKRASEERYRTTSH